MNNDTHIESGWIKPVTPLLIKRLEIMQVIYIETQIFKILNSIKLFTYIFDASAS